MSTNIFISNGWCLCIPSKKYSQELLSTIHEWLRGLHPTLFGASPLSAPLASTLSFGSSGKIFRWIGTLLNLWFWNSRKVFHQSLIVQCFPLYYLSIHFLRCLSTNYCRRIGNCHLLVYWKGSSSNVSNVWLEMFFGLVMAHLHTLSPQPRAKVLLTIQCRAFVSTLFPWPFFSS